jgi:DNA polymerase-3 subunit epsilon
MPDILRQPLHALPLTFLDVETTGLHPDGGHRVCELAILRVEPDGSEQAFDSLVNPKRPIEPGAFAVNRISAEMLEDAPCFAGVADALLAMLHGSVLVAHNAPFDVRFLQSELAQLARPALHIHTIDTLVLSRRLLQRSSHSLPALASDLHLDPPSHRAMQDVLTLRGVFTYLYDRLRSQEITRLGDVLRLQRGLSPGQPEPVPPPLIAEALQRQVCLRIVYRTRGSPKAEERIVRPYDVVQERRGLHLRAYCYLRNERRTFIIDKIEAMELIEE